MGLKLRTVLGRPLKYSEVDANFTYLEEHVDKHIKEGELNTHDNTNATNIYHSEEEKNSYIRIQDTGINDSKTYVYLGTNNFNLKLDNKMFNVEGDSNGDHFNLYMGHKNNESSYSMSIDYTGNSKKMGLHPEFGAFLYDGTLDGNDEPENGFFVSAGHAGHLKLGYMNGDSNTLGAHMTIKDDELGFFGKTATQSNIPLTGNGNTDIAAIYNVLQNFGLISD